MTPPSSVQSEKIDRVALSVDDLDVLLVLVPARRVVFDGAERDGRVGGFGVGQLRVRPVVSVGGEELGAAHGERGVENLVDASVDVTQGHALARPFGAVGVGVGVDQGARRLDLLLEVGERAAEQLRDQ